jgi:hypothetical protein
VPFLEDLKNTKRTTPSRTAHSSLRSRAWALTHIFILMCYAIAYILLWRRHDKCPGTTLIRKTPRPLSFNSELAIRQLSMILTYVSLPIRTPTSSNPHSPNHPHLLWMQHGTICSSTLPSAFDWMNCKEATRALSRFQKAEKWLG